MSSAARRARMEALKNGNMSSSDEEEFYNEEEQDNYDDEEDLDEFIVEDQGILFQTYSDC